MLVIRQAQMRRFSEAALESLERRLKEHIRLEWPARFEQLGDAGSGALASRVTRRAEKCGIENSGGILVLLELWLQYGEGFERSPDAEWARNMLRHPSLPGHVKMAAIQDRFDARTGGRKLVPQGGTL